MKKKRPEMIRRKKPGKCEIPKIGAQSSTPVLIMKTVKKNKTGTM